MSGSGKYAGDSKYPTPDEAIGRRGRLVNILHKLHFRSSLMPLG